MLLLRGYYKWRGISFLGDHFSTVAIGRKLNVIVLFCVGSSYVVLCCLVLVCGIQYLLLVLYRVFFGCHESTDALAKVADLDVDIPQEGVACPLSHDHDCP